MGRVVLGVCALGCALVVAFPAAGAPVAAAPGRPPAGKVLLGVVGPNPRAFDRLTGRRHVLHVIFGAFRNGRVRQLVEAEHAAGRLPILSLSSRVAPGDIARGAEDRWLVALAAAVNGARLPVWLRPLPEMNGHWNPWSAFDASGRRRGARHSTRSFVRAFRRIATIARGGTAAELDARLRAVRLPPLRVRADVPASGQVGIVWNPQGHGTPDIRANGPRAYWPGGRFVDYVANDLYSDSGEPSWRGMDALYAYGKPFLVAEWGLEGEDDVAFARRMFAWIERHPRTVGLVYFNRGWSGGTGLYELRTKPRSLRLYRREARAARFAATPGR